jgi:hypothetical protein
VCNVARAQVTSERNRELSGERDRPRHVVQV